MLWRWKVEKVFQDSINIYNMKNNVPETMILVPVCKIAVLSLLLQLNWIQNKIQKKSFYNNNLVDFHILKWKRTKKGWALPDFESKILFRSLVFNLVHNTHTHRRQSRHMLWYWTYCYASLSFLFIPWEMKQLYFSNKTDICFSLYRNIISAPVMKAGTIVTKENGHSKKQTIMREYAP